MAWSTRDLADLAGTTVKTVRHYHDRGLLAELERAPNGYKQYRAEHLVRMLQIRRLSELGFPLSQIRDFEPGLMVDARGRSGQGDGAVVRDGGRAEEVGEMHSALRALDAELAADISRRQQMREDIGAILDHGTAMDLPSGFGEVRGTLTEADRGLLLVYSQVLDAKSVACLRAMLAEVNSTEASRAFQSISPNASAEVRDNLARRYAPQVKAIGEKYGWADLLDDVPRRKRRRMQQTIGEAMVRLYNPAQIDVLVRVEEINGTAGEDRAPADSEDGSD